MTVTEVGLTELTAFYDENPVRGQDLLESTRIQFTAPIRYISDVEGKSAILGFEIIRETGFDLYATGVKVRFPASMRDEVSKITKGETVTVKAQFVQQEGFDLAFNGLAIQTYRQ